MMNNRNTPKKLSGAVLASALFAATATANANTTVVVPPEGNSFGYTGSNTEGFLRHIAKKSSSIRIQRYS